MSAVVRASPLSFPFACEVRRTHAPHAENAPERAIDANRSARTYRIAFSEIESVRSRRPISSFDWFAWGNTQRSVPHLFPVESFGPLCSSIYLFAIPAAMDTSTPNSTTPMICHYQASPHIRKVSAEGAPQACFSSCGGLSYTCVLSLTRCILGTPNVVPQTDMAFQTIMRAKVIPFPDYITYAYIALPHSESSSVYTIVAENARSRFTRRAIGSICVHFSKAESKHARLASGAGYQRA
eukprot:5155615-Pleurochrysis_carterae.AAC.1